MSNADKLREMVTEFTQTTVNLSGSLVKIDTLIADLTEQWHAINYAQNGIESDLEIYVETNKADYFYSYGSFGASGTGVLNEWMGFDEEIGLVSLTYIDGQRFTVTGNLTSTFTAGTSAVVTNGGVFSASTTISGSEYNISYPGATLVGLDDSRATAGLDGVYQEAYAPYGTLWDSDVTVQGYMDDWVFLDGFVTQLISLDGTYGIEGRLDNMYVARGVVENDYIKYDGMVPIMEVYAT